MVRVRERNTRGMFPAPARGRLPNICSKFNRFRILNTAFLLNSDLFTELKHIEGLLLLKEVAKR